MIKKIIDFITWLPKELASMFSDRASFFSLKRIERAICFGTAIAFEWIYFREHLHTITTAEVLMLTGPLFAMAGLEVAMTQSEKKITQLGGKVDQPVTNEKPDA
jgi:hypothetical protein